MTPNLFALRLEIICTEKRESVYTYRCFFIKEFHMFIICKSAGPIPGGTVWLFSHLTESAASEDKKFKKFSNDPTLSNAHKKVN